jgi:dolichyl-phosphate-mannose--protein O-mannosyl transferase
MTQPPLSPYRIAKSDPILPVAAIVMAFAALVFWRLGTPSKIMFDEVHYLPAARHLIDLSSRLNPEHPLLGKELIALGMMTFGDNPFGWRFFIAAYGTIGLYAAIRAFWWASFSRVGTMLFGLFWPPTSSGSCSRALPFSTWRWRPRWRSRSGNGRWPRARGGGCISCWPGWRWGCRWRASGTGCR